MWTFEDNILFIIIILFFLFAEIINDCYTYNTTKRHARCQANIYNKKKIQKNNQSNQKEITTNIRIYCTKYNLTDTKEKYQNNVMFHKIKSNLNKK